MKHSAFTRLAAIVATLQKVVFGGSGREQIRARRARAASGRRRKPGWLAMRVAAAALLALVSIAAWALNTPSTRADGCPLTKSCHPPELLNNDMLTGWDYLYYATPSELTALEDLEQQALQNTLTDHNLPASDASAVLSWGRDDAEAELWNLVRQAATASNPTADQKGATAWLKDMASREGLQSANDAGLEYTKWAGLDVTKYTSLVNTYDADLLAGKDTTTDKTNLENFLKQAPYNYNNTNISQATGGYCAYKAPAPYQTEYSDTSADCSGTPEGFYACLAGCIPPTPSLDQFEKWGVADATNNLVSNPSFTQSAQNIALGLGLGAVVGSVAAGVGVTIALGGALAGTAFEAAVFPFASTPWYVLGTGGAYILPEAGAVAASGIGAIVGAVILFIVGTTLQAINLANYLDAPGQVAGYVEQEATKTYDPQSMLADQSGAGELYSLFVGATLPPPPPTGDTVMPFPETNCNASYYDSYNYLRLCLDPPPPPAPSLETDPQFIVTPSGGTPGAPHGTISWYDTATKVSNTAYAHGGWFVNTITSNGTQLLVMDSDGVSRPLVQSLRIHYTDWSGNEQFATLSNLPGSGYQFISVNQQSSATALNPSTCVTDKTCAISDTLEYVNSSGAKFSAKVIPPPLPVISSAAVSANPVEGSAATLTAAATSPVNAVLSYRWQIEDKPLPTSTLTICMNAQMQVIPCPTPIVTVSGATATYKFPTSGTFAVTLVVTDSAGLYSTKSFTVTVGDVAPTLSLAPPCTAANTPAGCQAYAEPLGTATVLGGALNHVGAEDIETLDVNWGDGTTDDTIRNYACITPGCFSSTMQFNFSGITTNNGVIALPFSASHTYVNPGAYTVTVKATDQSGAVTTTTATETALALTTTTISSSPNPSVVGQSVTLTASVTSALAGTPTGTVAFKVTGATIAGCGAQAVNTSTETASCVTSALGLTQCPRCIFDYDNLTAVYSGDSVYATSTSAVVSQTVGQASTTTALSSSVNPSVWGQPVTLTASIAVSSPGAGRPDGTVEFKDGANDISGCGAQAVSTTTETATCVTSALSVASHSITALYSGSDEFIGSSSPALTQTVNKANTKVSVTTAANPVTHGQSVTFTANVVAVAPGAGTPTGVVTFHDGSTTLGTGSLNTSGGVTTATFTTSSLAVGAHAITASYGGSGDFNVSVSPALTQYINIDLSSYPTLPNGAYNLANDNLSGAYFVGLSLRNATLSGANLTNAVFLKADLTGANLSNSNYITSADFTDAIMVNVNLSNSNLKGSNFTSANLSGVNFTNANLKDANFTNANLTGTTGWSSANLAGVIWGNTTCPDGSNSASDGGTCVGHL